MEVALVILLVFTVDVPGRMSEQLCAHAKIVNEMVEMGFANDLIHKAIDIVSKKAGNNLSRTFMFH